MSNEYYGVPTTPTDDFLAHWGVKGMKWGVRKAIDRTGRPKSRAYLDAEKKLKRATALGGVVGGLAYAAKHKDEINKTFPSKKKHTKKNRSAVQLSSREKAFEQGAKKAGRKGGLVGALTVGGGAGGGAIATARYIRQHPKEYAAYKKKLNQMSYKDRMKAIWR